MNAVIITYNHRDYIEKAIEGALAQKFSGDYKIIIHDDCSGDGTEKLCRKFRDQNPELIDLYQAPQNKGMIRSWADALQRSTAKYTAICEGDDYWTDPGKLQKQVDFLEANPGYAVCCHRVYIQKDGKKPKLDDQDVYATSTEADYDIEMMAKYGNLIATPSAVYRNRLFSSLPAWFDQSPIGDYVLHMMNAQYGKIKYFPGAMAVYRDHSRGAWGGKTIKDNAANMIKVIGLLLTEPFAESVKLGLRDQLQKNKAIWLYELMKEDWDLFCKEFSRMMDDDRNIAVVLVEKIKKDTDAIRQSRIYRVIEKIKRIAKKIN